MLLWGKNQECSQMGLPSEMVEMSLRPTELRENSHLTRSPHPNDSHIEMTSDWSLQLLLTEPCALCLLGGFAPEKVILSLPSEA